MNDLMTPAMDGESGIRIEGLGRKIGPLEGGAGETHAAPVVVELEADGFTITTAGEPPLRAAYRDLASVAIQAGGATIGIGEGQHGEQWLIEQVGNRLGLLVSTLRDRRLRQRLADSLVQVPSDPIELIEYSSGASEHGVAHLVFHPWGLVLAPVDERLAWWRVPRAALGSITLDQMHGAVEIAPDVRLGVDDASARPFRLMGLGAASVRMHEQISALRAGAFSDAAAMVEALIPDAPFGARRAAGALLVDGVPAGPDDLGEGWQAVEAAILSEPTFAESYQALVAKSGSLAPMRRLALAPNSPGSPDATEAPERKAWTFVVLPGNLVALELVSEGSHATYCFRIAPRAVAAEGGLSTAPAMEAGVRAAVNAISRSLVDTRFLREPIALPAEQLALPENLRYRLALAALPSLAAARARFVARIVHRDAESWGAAIDDLIAWHGTQRDDAATWPGRAAQESQVSEAAGGD